MCLLYNINLFPQPVETALADAKLEKSDIDDIILIGNRLIYAYVWRVTLTIARSYSGGSTRIPEVQRLLSDFLGGKKLSQRINPGSHFITIVISTMTD